MGDLDVGELASPDPSRPAGPTRPGVLVVDAQKFAVADLDRGDLRTIDLDELIAGDLPELAPTTDRAVEAVRVGALRPGELLDADARVVLYEPLALRLQDRRVLAWDREQGCYVELDEVHLRVLRRLARPARPMELLLEHDGADMARACAQLLSLHLLTPAGSADPAEDPGTEASPTPDAADEAEPEPVESSSEVSESLPTAVVGGSPARSRSLLGRLARRLRSGRAPRPADPAAGPSVSSEPEVVDPGPVDAPEPTLDEHPVVPAVAASSTSAPPTSDVDVPVADARVPVIPLFHFARIYTEGDEEWIDPCLSIGSLFAYARSVDGGRLERTYHLQRVAPHAEEVFAEWAADPRPAIFVFSDYLWNVERHLDLSRRIRELSADSIILHGGPSSPKYDVDTQRFFDENPAIDVAARGEGELTFAEILDRLDGCFDAAALDRLADVEGITYRRRDTDGPELVRTPDRGRTADLDAFPSAYLTGELDLLTAVPWHSAAFETNRGCPYGCTFCDWGSATMSRIRKFDLERVYAELEWILQNAPTHTLLLCDANFGILERDVEITQRIVDLKEQYPNLGALIFSGLAKNTVKHTQRIFDLMVGAGIATMAASLAIQTTDPGVLEIANRKNIRLDRYDELADSFAEHGLPVMTDLLFGLPGSTVDTFAADLQHCFDRGVTARMFPLLMLPNSPMNEPGYKAEHQIVVDERGLIVGSSSYDRDDYRAMERLRLLYRASEHLGVLRYVLRFLQWDHGIPALQVLRDLDAVITNRGDRFPLLAFYGRLLDLYSAPPVDWAPFYDEVVEVVQELYGVELDPSFEAVLATQLALMPAHGRTFPARVHLEHDVFAYVRANKDRTTPRTPLSSFGPADFKVDDPADVCNTRLQRNDFVGRREMESGNLFWVGLDWELASPATRPMFTNLHLTAASTT